MRKLFIAVMALISIGLCFSQDASLLDKADALHEADNHEGVKKLLLDNLDTAKNDQAKGEFYWRISRAVLNIADELEAGGGEKKALIALFEEGESYADKTIELDPDSFLGYYWKSSNIGRAGQVRGVLNSLFAAKPMRELLTQAIDRNPEHADSYYVLAQLYEQLPGFPLSFGNKDSSVSLGRKSLVMHEKELAAGTAAKMDYDYWTEMAKHLYARNWDSAKRLKEQEQKNRKVSSAEGILQESFYYEAGITLRAMSDREEAFEYLGMAIDGLEGLRSPNSAEGRDLQEAKDLLAEWES